MTTQKPRSPDAPVLFPPRTPQTTTLDVPIHGGLMLVSVTLDVKDFVTFDYIFRGPALGLVEQAELERTAEATARLWAHEEANRQEARR